MQYLKHIIIYAVLGGTLFLLGCKSSKSNSLSPDEPFATDETKVREIVSYLASDELMGRDSGSKGIDKAASYIEALLEETHIPPYFKTYRDTLSNFEPTSFNVVGFLEGTDPDLRKETILIGAHYDHIGLIAPVAGDEIANGANDNASGSAIVMEIARYFGSKRNNKRSLLFAWFSAEEKGLLGSEHLAEKLKNEKLDLYTVLNFEMVGVPLKDQDYLMYITGYTKSNLAKIANEQFDEKIVGFLPKAQSFRLFERSDNYPFFKKFGIPSHTFCTFDFSNYDYYHKPDDETNQLDFEHMAKVVEKSITLIKGVANDPKKKVLPYKS